MWPGGPVLELNVSGSPVCLMAHALSRHPGSRLWALLGAEAIKAGSTPLCGGSEATTITPHGIVNIDDAPSSRSCSLARDSQGRIFLPYDPHCFAVLVSLIHMWCMMGADRFEEDSGTALQAVMASVRESTLIREQPAAVFAWRWSLLLDMLGPFPRSWSVASSESDPIQAKHYRLGGGQQPDAPGGHQQPQQAAVGNMYDILQRLAQNEDRSP